MFDNMPQVNVPQTAYVKRRRLITTEMARSRLESGEWHLRSMMGTSVRCRFFFELFDGDVPLNTLSCKICNATYSVQSRSHYREHVRRRHAEVYCVRNNRSQLSKNSSMVMLDDASANFGADDSLIDTNSPYNTANGGYVDGEAEFEGDEEEDVDGGFSLPFNNDNSLAGTEVDDDGAEDLDDGGSPAGDSDPANGDQMPLLNSSAKARRIATTDTATVLQHLETGEWQKRSINGTSIRARFFVEIIEGDKTLNILLCKACGSTYSAQSRSHCVEHVKKRHQSILQGQTDDPDFEYDLWMETRRPSPGDLQQMSVPYTKPNESPQQSSADSAGPSVSTLASRALANRKTSIVRSKVEPGTPSPATVQTAATRKRKRFPEIITGPDETIATPSFEDVLQSIASQVLLNGGSDEEMKFNLDDFSKTLQSGAVGVLPSAEAGSSSSKRRLIDAAAPGSPREASPPLITGGINEQLFALSEMAEAEEKRKAKEAAAAAATKAAASSSNGGFALKPPTLESALSSLNKSNSSLNTAISNNKLSQLRKSVSNGTSAASLSSENGLKVMAAKTNGTASARMLAPPLVVKKPVSVGGQKLNHQQLLMASRTAALLSGNGDDGVSDGDDMSSRENGHQRFRGRDNKDLYDDSANGYYPTFSNGVNRGSHFDHSSYPSRQQNTAIQYAQQQGGNYNGRSQQSDYWAQRHHQSSSMSGSYSEEFNGRNSVSSRSNGFDSSNASQCTHEAAFCQSCKSEFPNVIKGLNQLYSSVKDLTDVLRQALSQPSTADQLRNNSPMLSRALHRLDAVTHAGNAAVQTFVATAARHSASTANGQATSIISSSSSKLVPADAAKRTSHDIERSPRTSDAISPSRRDAGQIESAPSLQRMDCDGDDDDVEECEEVLPDKTNDNENLEKTVLDENEENEIIVLSPNDRKEKMDSDDKSAEKISSVKEVLDDDDEEEV